MSRSGLRVTKTVRRNDAPAAYVFYRVRQRNSRSRHALSRRGPPLEQLLEKRIKRLSAWLDRNAPYCTQEQAHLDEGSRERAYWHYGYVVALADVRDFVRNGRPPLPRAAVRPRARRR